MKQTSLQIEFYAHLLTAPSFKPTARLVVELLTDLDIDDLAAVQKRAHQLDPVRFREIDRMIRGGCHRPPASGGILHFPRPKAGG
jgi:hypothetical protein